MDLMDEFLYAQWPSIRDDILKNTRAKDRLKELLEQIADDNNLREPISKGSIFYRSRIVISEDIELMGLNRDPVFCGYEKNKCLAPPKENAKSGRCSAEHNPVLYMAKDIYTAMVESIPVKCNRISLAKLVLNSDVEVCNFCDVDSLGIVCPVCYDSYSELESNFYFVKHIADEYKVSQFISETIKELGYDGIMYRSSLSKYGINVMLFDEKKVEAQRSDTFICKGSWSFMEKEGTDAYGEIVFPKSVPKIVTECIISNCLPKHKVYNKESSD